VTADHPETAPSSQPRALEPRALEPRALEPPAGCPAHGGRFPLYGPELAKDPAGVYARLREHGPVAPVELAPGVPASLVTGYAAALGVLRDPNTFPKDPRGWQATVAPDCPVLPMMMYRPNCRHADGSAHSRLRMAVTDSLARVDLFALRGYVETSADTLIARFAGKGAADLVSDYARVLPLLVFNEIFGCPPDLGDSLVMGMSGIFDTVNAKQSNEIMRAAVLDLVQLKRRDPGHDVTSWLAEHPVRLTDEEMMHQILTLLGAGTEPTQNLIVNGLRLLLSDDRFGGDLSGGNLQVEDAIDEVLWTDPPMANFAMTYPTHDVDFEGVVLPKDQPVVISLAAANTDPMLTAEHREGNRAHLAWSAGPHTCPAQGQARLITSVAIEKVLDALPEMELAVPVRLLKWRPGPFHRALTALPVNFPPVSGPMAGDAWRDRPDTDTRPDLRMPPLRDGRRGGERPDGLAAVLSAARARPARKNRWRDSVRKWFRRL
jgi:cytochrome P450